MLTPRGEGGLDIQERGDRFKGTRWQNAKTSSRPHAGFPSTALSTVSVLLPRLPYRRGSLKIRGPGPTHGSSGGGSRERPRRPSETGGLAPAAELCGLC